MTTSSSTSTIGVVAALPEELSAVRERMNDVAVERKDNLVFLQGLMADRPVVALATGDGRLNADRGIQSLLDRFDVDGLVGVGLAGGLSPSLAQGDCVWAAELRTGAGRVEGLVPPIWSLQERAAARLEGAVVVSSGDILCSVEAKSRLWASCGRPDPAVVDLESETWARRASAREIPWLILRAVSDSAAEELPVDFNRFRSARWNGGLDRGRLARHALLRPALLWRLAGLRHRASGCARRLADLLEEILGP